MNDEDSVPENAPNINVCNTFIYIIKIIILNLCNIKFRELLPDNVFLF